MQQLIDSKDNGLIKIVTGLRRVGKINGRLLKPAIVMLIRLHRHTLKERTCNSCLRFQSKNVPMIVRTSVAVYTERKGIKK